MCAKNAIIKIIMRRSKIFEIPYILARYNVERVGLAVGAAWPNI
jgi:hypothetical protein